MFDRDRNLLFGIFAVQLKKLTPSQLVDAAASWAADPSRDLSQRLCEAGVLSESDRILLAGLVDHAVKAHGNDASATLHSFGGDEQIQQSFAGSIVATPAGGLNTVMSPPVSLPNATDDVPGVDESPGRYLSVVEYARGGMGRVLLVHDEHLNRDIALKELLPDLHGSTANAESPVRKSMPFIARFLQEARITGQLEHPSIVPVYELGKRRDGTVYYTMKLVRGKTLAKAIKEAGNLEGRLKLLPHFVDLCNAIAYAHSRGVIHRDLKPANVMVGEFGETVVLDWGLAKAKDKTDVHADGLAETIRAMNVGSAAEFAKTTYGQAMGTPAYMPPEQAKGELDKIDERSDIYSLGAILYEILTGKAPFSGSTIHEMLYKAINEMPVSIRSFERRIPADILKLCERALAKDPANRFASAKAFAEAVQACKLRPPKGQVRKVIERATVAVLSVYVVFTFFMNWKTGNDVDRELEQHGLANTTFADWMAKQSGTDSANAKMAGTLVAHTGATSIWYLDKFNPGLKELLREDRIKAVRDTGNAPLFTQYVERDAEIRRIVAESSAVVDLIKEIAAMPHATPSALVEVSGIRGRTPSSIEIPEFMQFLDLTYVCMANAYIQYQNGQAAEAIYTCSSVFEIADHLRDTPFLISKMVALTMDAIVLSFLEGLPPDFHIPRSDLDILKLRMAAADPRGSYYLALEEERAAAVFEIELLRSTPILGSERNGFLESYLVARLYSSWPTRWWFNQDLLAFIHYHDTQIGIARRDPVSMEIASSESKSHVKKIRKNWYLHPLTSYVAANFSGNIESTVEIETRFRQAHTFLSIVAYREDKGRFPQSLEDLMPNYLSQVPLDPFSNSPFHYELTSGGYLITSAGKDNKFNTLYDIKWRCGVQAPVIAK
jgi:serine/threonine protein kinase